MRAHTEALAFIRRWPCSPVAPPHAQRRLRWRRLHRHPGDSWGWWRRWWTLPAPQSRPLWCWCRSRRAVVTGSTASCRARPWEDKQREEDTEEVSHRRGATLQLEAHVMQRIWKSDASCEHDTQAEPTPAVLRLQDSLLLHWQPLPPKQQWRMPASKSPRAWWERLIAELLNE